MDDVLMRSERSPRGYWLDSGRWGAAVALVAGAMIAVMWILVVERIRREHRNTVLNVDKQNNNLTLALEAHTVQVLRSADHTLIQVAREHQEGRLDIEQLAKAGVIDDRLFYDIFVIDRHGRVVSTRFPGPVNWRDRQFFRVHQTKDSGRTHIHPPRLSEVTGKWGIDLSRRINNPNGSFGGIVAAAIDPHYFTDFYAKADLGSEGLVILAGLDGIVRARRVGAERSFGQDISKSILIAEQAKSPAGTFFGSGAFDGIPRFFSYRTLDDYSLIVVVAASQAEALAGFYDRRQATYVAASIATGVIAIFSVALIGGLGRQNRARQEAEIKHIILATQQETLPDALLLVDERSRIASYNQRFMELWRIPEGMLRAGDDEPVLEMVVAQMEDPEGFLERVRHLFEHRQERSSDVLRTRDGRTVERYSAPVIASRTSTIHSATPWAICCCRPWPSA